MFQKFVSATAAVALLASSTASANIDQFLNNAIVEMNSGGTIQTNRGTILYGGGLQMRAPSYNFTPFSITAPSIRAGCGGIDLTFGAFSFLNIDQIVAMMQGMMAQAPGVAFDLALKTLCPTCAQTLESLEDMANQINGLNMDSCQAVKATVGWLKDKVNDSLGLGKSGPDWLVSINKNYLEKAKEHLGEIRNKLAASGCSPTDKTCGAKFFVDENVKTPSFLQYMMMDDSQDVYLRNSNFTQLVRSFTGDFLKKPMSDGADGANSGVIIPISPQVFSPHPFLRDGKSVDRSVLDQNTKNVIMMLAGIPGVTSAYGLDETGGVITVSDRTNMRDDFKNKLNSIQNKIASRSAFSTDEIKFLGMFRMPIYQVINKMASFPNGDLLLDQIKDEFANMLAYEITYEYLTRVRTVIARQKSKMTDDIMEKIPYQCSSGNCKEEIEKHLDKMSEGAGYMAAAAYILAAESNQVVNNKIAENAKLLDTLNKTAAYMMARSNPKIFESYLFSMALTQGQAAKK